MEHAPFLSGVAADCDGSEGWDADTSVVGSMGYCPRDSLDTITSRRAVLDRRRNDGLWQSYALDSAYPTTARHRKQMTMKITYESTFHTHKGGDKPDLREDRVSDFVEQHINPDSAGNDVSNLYAETQQLRESLAQLVEMLTSRGLLTLDEILKIAPLVDSYHSEAKHKLTHTPHA
jgi:hypothetical protein